VRLSVELNEDSRFGAVEVSNKATYCDLATELEAAELAVSQERPKARFRRGLASAQLSGSFEQQGLNSVGYLLATHE
jgi:hypothetical protein